MLHVTRYSKNLNNVQVERPSYQKHLGIILDEKLNFKQHIDGAISKVNKGISVIKDFDTFCQGNHSSQFTKLFKDLYLMMVVSFMTNLIICLSVKN